MHDIPNHDRQCEDGLPDGAGAGLVILGGLVTLPLVVAAIVAGKPLWAILTIWAVGGPALTLVLALLALRRRHPEREPEPTDIVSEGALHHV